MKNGVIKRQCVNSPELEGGEKGKEGAEEPSPRENASRTRNE